MTIEFDKLDQALSKACKDKVYMNLPFGSCTGRLSSISLAISGEDWRPYNKRRHSLANISGSIYRQEKSKLDDRRTSWNEPIRTARDDAELLMLLWNNAEELIRLAKLGEKAEKAFT